MEIAVCPYGARQSPKGAQRDTLSLRSGRSEAELDACMSAEIAGQYLKTERERRGMSQNAVAQAVGANDQSAVHRWENAGPQGRPPPPSIIEGYARLFETTPEFIMRLYGYSWSEGDDDGPFDRVHTLAELRQAVRGLDELPGPARRAIEAAIDLAEELERRDRQ